MADLDVEFCILTDPDGEAETWTPVEQLAPSAGLALWNTDHVSCCTLQAGFRISHNGAPWNANALDEIAMAGTWISATTALLRGSTRASVWAWEESNMTLSRRGELVDALDVHYSGTIVCPLITWSLPDFARALAIAARAGATWLAAVCALATKDAPELTRIIGEQLGGLDWLEAAAELEALAASPMQTPPPHDSGPLPQLWLAAMTRDLQRLVAGLEADAGASTLALDGKPLLHLCIQYGWLEGVDALLAAGCPVQLRDQPGFTPLQQAARRVFGRTDPVVERLLRAGATIDPISACLMNRPEALAARAAEGVTLPETLNWWALGMVSGERPLTPQWEAAVRAAVAAGTPVQGVKGGLGGWHESPIETASKRGRSEIVALLRSLS